MYTPAARMIVLSSPLAFDVSMASTRHETSATPHLNVEFFSAAWPEAATLTTIARLTVSRTKGCMETSQWAWHTFRQS